jgi:hypothetical protein
MKTNRSFAGSLFLGAMSFSLHSTPSYAQASKLNEASVTFDVQPLTTSAPGGGQKAFKWGDRVYARMFFAAPLKTYLTAKEGTFQPIYLSAALPGAYASVGFDILKTDLEKNYLDLEILPDPKNVKYRYHHSGQATCGDTFHGVIRSLDDNQRKKQPVTVTLKDKNGAVLREATFDLDMSGSTREKIFADCEAITSAGDAAFAELTPIPNPGKAHNATLANALAAQVVRADSNTKRARVIFIDDAWDTERDALGRITGRTLAAEILTQEKEKGRCTIERRAFIRQEYAGGRFVGPGEFANTGGDVETVSCSRAFGGAKKK